MNIKRRSFMSLIPCILIGSLAASTDILTKLKKQKPHDELSSFPQALEAILNGGRARRKGWNIYYTLFEDSLWAFGDQGTGVKIECVDTEHLLANDWIIESTGRRDQR